MLTLITLLMGKVTRSQIVVVLGLGIVAVVSGGARFIVVVAADVESAMLPSHVHHIRGAPTTEALLGHTLAKNLEAPRAADVLLRLVEAAE